MPITTGMLISFALSIAFSILKAVLFPPRTPQRPNVQQPTVPTPADGKHNLKQNVPFPAIVFGRVKKGGDYAFLEERDGTAFHALVWSAHRIEGFVAHYLHDESVTLDGNRWVVAPAHFGPEYVRMDTREGLDVSNDYGQLTSKFPEIWSIDHRGDGLATVLMTARTVNQERYMDVFPQQMPLWTGVGDGALLYDPRQENHDPLDHDTWAYSQNLALGRLFHLTQPWGGKLNIADLYLPDWIVAADVCDEMVDNRDAVPEPRYHGGFWWRTNSDAVDVGQTFDQAAELVLYERPDGLIGVHAGQMVTPDIRITTDDILEFHYDANRRLSSTVLAVRGRWTDPDAVYNTVDAAIWGDPYTDDDTQRTKTVDNAAVQYHNHMQRLQKLAFIRANAPRVSLTIGFDALSLSRHIASRRFVTVHYPARGLEEATVEIVGRPKLSLRNLTISIDGIVVPATLFAFDGPTEEGEPSGIGDGITATGIPEPGNFTVVIASDVLNAGLGAAYARAAWDYVDDSLTYEFEYQVSDESEPPLLVFSRVGETEVRTGYLQDNVEYRFRVRTRSGGGTSDWTAYEYETVVADFTAPAVPTGFSSSKSGNDVTLNWTNPNSANFYKANLYRGTTNVFGSAALFYEYNGGTGSAREYTDYDLSNDTYYYWVTAVNASNVASAEVGPTSQTIP